MHPFPVKFVFIKRLLPSMVAVSILFTLGSEGFAGNEEKKGGVISGGGGGKSQKEEQSFREFEAAFNQIVPLLPNIFRRLTGNNHPMNHNFMDKSAGTELPPALLAKFIGEKSSLPPLETHLRSIQYHLLWEGPCKNAKGEEFDGSASVETNSVCVSYDQLRSKLNDVDIWPRLAGLLVHEVSHLRGTQHLGGREIDEAEFIQAQVEKFVTWRYPGQLAFLRDRLSTQLGLEADLLSDLHLELDSIAPFSSQEEKLKHAFLELSRWIDTSVIEVHMNLDLLSPQELNLYLALSEQVMALSMFFKADAKVRWTMHEAFIQGQEEAIPLRAYLSEQKRKCDPFCEQLGGSELIYKVSYKDSAAFKKQFAEILRVLKELRKSVAAK